MPPLYLHGSARNPYLAAPHPARLPAMLIFDCHLDLSMNALEWNRDLTQSVEAIRQRERGRNDKRDRAGGVVSLPEMRRGQVGLCTATLIARYVAPDNPLPGWHSPEIAWAQTQGQLAWYRAMDEAGQMAPITTRDALDRHVELWTNNPPPDAPIGYVLSLEGADSIRTPRHLELAWEQGLRAIGPAHYGVGRYAQGTHVTGGFPAAGRELLAEMQRLGMILDATHLSDECFWEALDLYQGPIWASHSNCRALVPNQRQFDDAQIKALIDRGAVIGGALDAWMMVPNWTLFQTRPEETGVRLSHLVDHWDHICQIAGSAQHIAIGTDLDGGFGKEQCPLDVETIADLQTLPDLLAARGYSQADIEGILYGNWVRFLRNAWK
jgi:membrane dipeptidase